MAAILHLPETIIDLMVILINMAVAGAAFYTLRVFDLTFFTETAPQIFTSTYEQVTIWIQSLLHG
jgi:hypothetical protein